MSDFTPDAIDAALVELNADTALATEVVRRHLDPQAHDVRMSSVADTGGTWRWERDGELFEAVIAWPAGIIHDPSDALAQVQELTRVTPDTPPV